MCTNASPVSPRLGKLIVQAAAGNLKKISLEFGGKSPAIVFPDADTDVAIRGTAHAIFFNMGQCCTSGSRLYAYTVAVLDQGSAERCGDVALAAAGRPEQQQVVTLAQPGIAGSTEGIACAR